MRMYKNRIYSPEQDVVMLFGSLVIGASGAVQTVKGGGIKSITKLVADGAYEVELDDKFSRLLHSTSGFVSNAVGGSGIATVEINENPANLQTDFKADSKYVIQFYDYAGVAANAAAGSVLSFQVFVRRSSVGPFDA